MTIAEAAERGLLPGQKGVTVGRKRTTRKAEPRDGALMRCVTHGGEFTRDVDENRHVDAHHGCRLEWVP